MNFLRCGQGGSGQWFADGGPFSFPIPRRQLPGGAGVGLAMTFRLVQLHNGTIDFTSEVNRGTTFRVALPADAQQDRQY
jgi:signal transduction histidine kinase